MYLPKITIGIPTRNRADLLKKALESALSQNYAEKEVLVSDNCSSDATPEVLKVYEKSVKILRPEKFLTMAENWNNLLFSASGEYFLLLSDDDLLLPGALAALVKALNRDPGNAALVYGASSVLFSGTGEARPALWTVPPEEERAGDFILESYRGKRYYPTGASMMRVSDMTGDGGYLWGGFSLVMDMGMAVKVCLKEPDKKVFFSPETVFTSVLHESNATGGAAISMWAEDIYSLSRTAAGIAPPRSPSYSAIVSAANRYGIRFVFGLAVSRRKSAVDFAVNFFRAFSASMKFLTAGSLPFFLWQVCKCFLPDFVLKIKREFNEKKVFFNCF